MKPLTFVFKVSASVILQKEQKNRSEFQTLCLSSSAPRHDTRLPPHGMPPIIFLAVQPPAPGPQEQRVAVADASRLLEADEALQPRAPGALQAKSICRWAFPGPARESCYGEVHPTTHRRHPPRTRWPRSLQAVYLEDWQAEAQRLQADVTALRAAAEVPRQPPPPDCAWSSICLGFLWLLLLKHHFNCDER